MNKLGLLLALLISTTALASSNVIKDIDSISATGGAALAVPATGSNIVSDTASQTVTNKSMSGASNTFTLIPVSALATGTGLGGKKWSITGVRAK